MIDYKSEKNLILCGNQDFIIKVDKLQNQKIRYACWRKPKSISEPPDLILLNGHIRFFASLDKYEYVFPYGKWTYIIEQIISSGGHRSSHIFIEVSDNQNYKSTWKLEDLRASSGYPKLF